MYQGSVSDVLVPELLDSDDVVVHLAARTESSTSAHESASLVKNNLESTAHVLKVCRSADASVVFPSSSSVYEPSDMPVSETSSVRPVTSYAKCKAMEEELVSKFQNSGLRARSLRFGTIFGISPGMRFHTAVNKFCWEAATGKPVEIWQHAHNQLRPYLSVGDACAAISHVIHSSCYGDGPINIATTSATVQQVLAAIELSGVTVTTKIVESEASAANSINLDTSLARRLGFTFVDNLVNGVSETLDQFRGIWRSRDS